MFTGLGQAHFPHCEAGFKSDQNRLENNHLALLIQIRDIVKVISFVNELKEQHVELTFLLYLRL